MASKLRKTDERSVIVVVDDDDLFRESIEQNLTESDYQVIAFADAPSAHDYLSSQEAADLVLLDWKMSPMSGIELLRKLRAEGTEVPVIFLTALSDQIYEEAALIGGAVDFVEKSRSFTILLKRIQLNLEGAKAVSRAAAPNPAATLVDHGNLTLDTEANRADWKGRRVGLSRSEFSIVSYLVHRSGRDVAYRELYDLVRGGGFAAGAGPEGYRANVRTFIRRIRQKFRDIDNDFEEIENFPGFGYRWRGLEE
jgi:two-component system response regulator ChvI